MAEGPYLSERITRPPRAIFAFSILVIVLVGFTLTVLITVPWRQTVFAQGEVAIFNPEDRPQPVDAQIKGRLVRLVVVDGQKVEKGDLIAELEDRDSKFLDPDQVARWKAQREALRDKAAATQERLAALDGQRRALTEAQAAAIPSARLKTEQSRQKRLVLQQQIRLGKQDVETARLQQERTEVLLAEGLKSQRELELAIQKLVEAETKLQKMEGDLTVAETEIEILTFDQSKIAADLAEKQQKVSESMAKGEEDLADLEEKLQKLESEMAILEVRRDLQRVVAPRSGRVINLKKIGPGELVKEGDVLATILPTEQKLGVELYIRGLDTPLVEVGRPVRLMFEGFPAVPFAGWPWAAFGTFGGRVTVVDPVATDKEDKTGFRIWVEPDANDYHWPSVESLRIGSKVGGWVLLDDVPLYYEIWRQLNAFPARPALDAESKETVKVKPVIRR